MFDGQTVPCMHISYGLQPDQTRNRLDTIKRALFQISCNVVVVLFLVSANEDDGRSYDKSSSPHSGCCSAFHNRASTSYDIRGTLYGSDRASTFSDWQYMWSVVTVFYTSTAHARFEQQVVTLTKLQTSSNKTQCDDTTVRRDYKTCSGSLHLRSDSLFIFGLVFGSAKCPLCYDSYPRLISASNHEQSVANKNQPFNTGSGSPNACCRPSLFPPDLPGTRRALDWS